MPSIILQSNGFGNLLKLSAIGLKHYKMDQNPFPIYVKRFSNPVESIDELMRI